MEPKKRWISYDFQSRDFPFGELSFLICQTKKYSLKLTAHPENRPKRPKRNQSSSNHPFSGAKILVSGRVDFLAASGFNPFENYCIVKLDHFPK